MAKKTPPPPQNSGHTCNRLGAVLVNAYSPKPNIIKTETTRTCSICGLPTHTTSNTTAAEPE